MADEFFEILVTDWYDRLYRFALGLSRNRDDALELTQQTFIRWAEKGHTLRDRKRVKSWLFTVLYREFITCFRHRKHIDGTPVEDVLEFTSAETVGPDVAADGQIVLKALWGLDEFFRAPLTLFYLQDHSYREIAEILDVPIGTVMSRLARGKEHLRKRVESGTDTNQKIIPMPSKKGESHG